MFKEYPDVRYGIDKPSGASALFLLFIQLLSTMEGQPCSVLKIEQRECCHLRTAHPPECISSPIVLTSLIFLSDANKFHPTMSFVSNQSSSNPCPRIQRLIGRSQRALNHTTNSLESVLQQMPALAPANANAMRCPDQVRQQNWHSLQN